MKSSLIACWGHSGLEHLGQLTHEITDDMDVHRDVIFLGCATGERFSLF